MEFKRYWLVKAHDNIRERTLQCPGCGHDKFAEDRISVWVESGEYSSRMWRYTCENCDYAIFNKGQLCERKAK